jgi:hypothetical protein
MQNNNTVDVQCRLRPAIRTAASRPHRKDAAPPGTGKLPRLTQVLAQALQFEEMVRSGGVKDFADIARLGCLSRARISQVLKLAWLAPDIQEEILGLPRSSVGRFDISEVAARRIAVEPAWRSQRLLWAKLKEEKHLE